jgi:hypothetical protein
MIFSLASQDEIMDNHSGSFIKRTISLQEERGGFSIEDMPMGTRISVETKNSIYEIEILKDSLISIKGGLLKDSVDVRFPKPVEAILLKNWLGEGMNMQIICNSVFVITSPIKNIIINPVVGESINLHWNRKD